MSKEPVLSFVLNGHVPFVRHPEQAFAPQEIRFYESLSETYIPLLEVFDRLDRDHIPFRMGLSLSPTLCHMLTDELLISRYLDYTDRQIEFGSQELERCKNMPQELELARMHYDKILDRRIFFTERYEKNILRGFDYYQKKGRLEILATAATHAFLPFYTSYGEAVQAQFEVAISTYRSCFGKYPQGFWLPELGWKGDLDYWLRSYNFGYTIVPPHALTYGEPYASKGTFYPLKTPLGIITFGRDFYAAQDLKAMSRDPLYRNHRDQGFELPKDQVEAFLGPQGSRTKTGYKYWAAGEDGLGKIPYRSEEALKKAQAQAAAFLDARLERLAAAKAHMSGPPLSICAFDADDFGRHWFEGPLFLETLFRESHARSEALFLTPSEILSRLEGPSIQTLSPEFSSWGPNGYAEPWLDSSNDWMYRHTMRALDRMVEMAERFPDNTGLKERALNQAAREILLVLASDWPKLLYEQQEHAEYARSRIEGSLRNFTTIYEALGSNYISTEWLTQLERRHNIFPQINYRIFRRKH
ncbi:MAG: DUF1957 domain-containing protein [Treponema sp.]|nr:DUF1957 domain-containing protein [Treponema sp.]